MHDEISPAYLSLRHVAKSFGGRPAVVDFSLDVGKGKLVCLLGPSGCGKTTTLRLIAGFESPDSGSILIAGRNVSRLRPYERNVGLLFQHYALFPHMTVEQNVSYGLKRRNYPAERIRQQCSSMLDLVKLTAFSQRMPHELSGGERQRVALARALAVGPEIMLLDEPLSALDAKLRQELRVELKEILRHIGITTLVVTHDQGEAMSMAEEIAVMRHGQVEQRGTPDDVYLRPRNKFVATFIGRANSFSGRILSQDPDGFTKVVTPEGIHLRITTRDRMSSECELYVRPERIRINDADRSANCIPATIVEVAPLGSEIHYWAEGPHGKRIAVVNQNSGKGGVYIGRTVDLLISPEDFIVLSSDKRDG